MLRKITAHLSIVLGGMCFVLFVVDAIKGGAMSFINNDITKAFIAILSLVSIFNSVILLAAQTSEQKMYSQLQQYRRQFGQLSRQNSAPVRRPAQPQRTATAVSRPAQPQRTATAVSRPAQPQPRPVSRPVNPQSRATSPRPSSHSRNPYSSNR